MNGIWAEVSKHIEALLKLSDQNLIDWTEGKVPKPGAMRAFEGRAGPYLINVVQANILNVGVEHHGVVIVKTGTIVRLPADVASKLWHQAASHRN